MTKRYVRVFILISNVNTSWFISPWIHFVFRCYYINVLTRNLLTIFRLLKL
jgi:hypothetical protein